MAQSNCNLVGKISTVVSIHLNAAKNSNTPQTRRVLAIGDVDKAEFADPIELLRSDSGVQLESSEKAKGPFELVLVFQSRPGSVEAGPIERLRAQTPLAGMAVVLGTWCEGEARTGAPLPHCERLFWYQFPAWWANVCKAWGAGRPTHWQQVAPSVEPTRIASGSLVAIDTADADAASALLVVFESLGLAAVWRDRRRPGPLATEPAAGVWVGGQLEDAEREQLAAFRSALPNDAPLVVLLDFPRRDRVDDARQLGATAVLGKPWRIDQLAAAINVSDKTSRTAVA